MIPRSRLPLLLALAAAALPGCASKHDYGARATRIDGAGAVLPTRLVRGLWLLEARLAQAPGEHLLLLDTGTDRMLLDLPLARRIGLRTTSDETVRTATGGSMPSMRLERLAWLSAGNVTFHDIEVAGIDLQPLRAMGGLPIVGIVGCDLFRGCLLELDYRRRRARVLPRSHAPETDAHEFSERIPWVTVRAGERELRVLVDTGFQHALAVPPGVAMPWLTVPRSDGELATLDGISQKATARLDGAIELGDMRWRDPLVVLAPGSPKIGTWLLRRCRLLLDAGGGKIWLERSPRR